MPETAALDANVLWSGTKRDFLLSLAKTGQYTPTWSTGTLNEVKKNYQEGLVETGTSERDATRRADRLVATMRRQFSNAEIADYGHRVGDYGLPDPGDEHVLAAADQAGAKTIVTDNVKHFPPGKLPRGIEVVTGPDFTRRMAEANPQNALRAVEQMAARSGRHGPKMAVEDVLKDMRERQGWPEAADIIRRHAIETGAVQSLPSPATGGQKNARQRQTTRPEPKLGRDRAESRRGRSETARGSARSQRRPER